MPEKKVQVRRRRRAEPSGERERAQAPRRGQREAPEETARPTTQLAPSVPSSAAAAT